nr:unnamed protein product [Haemonchus contortus]
MAVSSSPVNEPEEKQDCSPHREFDDRDESFYDAEDALSPHKSSHGCNVSAVHSGDSVDFSTSLTSEEYFEAASEISRLKLKRSWSCGNMVNDEASELHFGRPNGSALEIRFSNRLTFGLTGDRTDKHECPMEQLRERVVMDLKGGSGCTALYWLRGRKTIRDTSIPKWRGFSRGKFSGTSSQHILKPKTSEQRRVSILKYSSVLVEQDPQDHTDNGEQAPTTRKKDPKQIRIEAKTLCLRKWGDKVRNLSELLWFLQVFYHVNGPVLITKCEEVIERYVDPNGGNGRLPWKRYGRNVDVRRMFELGMFRVTSPKNRMEVQPVDCILNAGFRLVRKGLASELYKLLMKKEKVTTEDLLKHMDPLFENSQKPARLDEIRAAKKKLPDLITTDGVYWELKSNEELFVVTDVNL